ncbi:MAG TPA: glycosyltransferase family 4 protein [Pyrinomonadaceae bacterium]|jgi:glycosyltransferase involved in cell wall biosynthesis|nr:glycosyltransferase family 4 protein [Pyrinomonadaceae bacterium]
MKILYLTGGAGQMYCGSCLRDNALATELISRGHQVTLLPVYTPTLTDEENVSYEKVFFGGISVYLEQYLPVFRNSPTWLDRLWDSKPMLQMASRRSISTSPKMLGEMTVSMLKGEDGFQHKEITKLLDWLKREDRPDVVSLPYSLLLGLAKPIKESLGIPICCTLQGEDLFLEGLQEPYRSTSKELIRAHLKHVDEFISVSEFYADFMPGYLGIPRNQIRVVPLGINLEGYERKKKVDSRPPRIGYFARIAPEKGLQVLGRAYRRVRKSGQLTEARLEVAGYLAPEHRRYLEAIVRELKECGLGEEFTYHGVLNREQKISFLQSLDLLSVPATYDEPKGIFLLEAMACGVPVVQPRRGGFTEIIERTGGGLLVEPDNVDSLAAGILKVARDPELSEQLSDNGFAKVREHYSVARMADSALEVYTSLLQFTPEE